MRVYMTFFTIKNTFLFDLSYNLSQFNKLYDIYIGFSLLITKKDLVF